VSLLGVRRFDSFCKLCGFAQQRNKRIALKVKEASRTIKSWIRVEGASVDHPIGIAHLQVETLRASLEASPRSFIRKRL